MGKNKIGIIIGREFSIRVKKRSFILTTILTPLLFAGLMLVPGLIAYYTASSQESKKVSVYDATGVVEGKLNSNDAISFSYISSEDIQRVKNEIKQSGDENLFLLTINSQDSVKGVAVSLFSAKAVGMELEGSIERCIKDAVEEYKLGQYDIPNLKEVIAGIRTDVNISAFTLEENSEDEKESHVGIYMAIGYVASFMIYMFIFMFGSMVMRSVIEEKTTRIVEVIISSVKPFQLMMGKILGVAAVALTQFFIWIVLTVVIIFGVTAAIGGDGVKEMAGSTVQMSAVQQMATENLQANGVDVAQVLNSVQTPDVEEAGAEQEGFSNFYSKISGMLEGVNFVKIILCFVIYFALGYLLYASLFAAVGSAVDNEADTQQLIMPITIPLIVGLFIMMHTFQSPDSALSVWASIIPFTSPMVMMARIAYDVPTWQLLLSIALLLGTFVGFAYLSGKVYRIGILMYGKKANWKDIAKWLRR